MDFKRAADVFDMQFESVSPMHLRSSHPSTSASCGGGYISISGSNIGIGYLASGGLRCSFDGSLGTKTQVLSSAVALCEIIPPPQNPSPVRLSIIDDSARAVSSNALDFGMLPKSVITLADDVLHGDVAGGALVAVNGVSLYGETSGKCHFDSVQVTGIVHENRIECISPARQPSSASLLFEEVHGCTAHLGHFQFHDPYELHAAVSAHESAMDGASVVLDTCGGEVVLLHSPPSHRLGVHSMDMTAVVAGSDAPVELHASGVLRLLAPMSSRAGFAALNIASSFSQPISYVGEQHQFEYLDPVVMVGMMPAHGSFGGGTLVHVEATNMRADVSTCYFGSQTAESNFISSRLMICEAPPAPEASAVHVGVKHAQTACKPALASYLYEAPASLFRITPDTSSEVGGQLVELHGKHIAGTVGSLCTLDSIVFAPALARGAVAARCRLPARPAGDRALTFANNGRDFGVAHTVRYHLAPRVVAATPASGTILGGTSITIFGSALSQDVVQRLPICVEGNALTSFALHGAGTSALCMTAPRAAGKVAIAHVADFVYDRRLIDVDFEFLAAPALAFAAPAFGMSEGGTVVFLQGHDLLQDRHDAMRLHFGDTSAPFVSVSTMLAVAEAPGSAVKTVRKVNVDAALNGVDFGERKVPYTYQPAPTVSGVSPSIGPRFGGIDVFVTGRNFAQADRLHCRFGTSGPIGATYVSETVITCKSPGRGPGSVAVEVSANNCDLSTDGLTFEY